MGQSEVSVQVSVLLERVNDGWRWTLRDRYGETQGWEPSWRQASEQANHVQLSHMWPDV